MRIADLRPRLRAAALATLLAAGALGCTRDPAPRLGTPGVAGGPAAPAAPVPEPEPACGAEASALRFDWPARGAVTSPFGLRGGRRHEGIDISSSSGLAVRAAAAGRVTFSDDKPGYGRVVILEHAAGYTTVYAHNQDNLVLDGARVEGGQVIADMGLTGKAAGRHLHFEIRLGDRPLDPLGCLPPRTQ